MNEQAKPNPFFIADQKALDLLNSVCAPWGTPIEWIDSGKGLLSWLTQAELISKEESQIFLTSFSADALNKAAEKVVALREYFRAFIKKHAGSPITASALDSLEKVNDILQHDSTFSQIAINADDRSLNVKTMRHYRQAEDLLLPLAHEIMKCVCEADFSRIRICENEPCPLWFLDTSKNGRRRWCSMAVCGNRAKAAAHREKKKHEKLKAE